MRTEDRPLRIARIIARLNVGGPTRHVVWLSALLPKTEFETLLITGTIPTGEDDMSDFALAHGVRPFVIPEMSREISPRDLVAVWKLYRLFTHFRPDIVHTHTAKAGTAGRIAGWLYRWLTPSVLLRGPRSVLFVHTFHGHVFHSYYGRLKTWLFLTIERLLARWNTTAIITLSEQQRDEIHGTFRVGRREQFRIIPLGVEIPEAATGARDMRESANIGETEMVVALVGRLVPIKNVELFLRVAAAAGWNPSVRFAIYGDGALRLQLEQRAQDLGIASRIVFAGMRPVGDIYPAVDIVALTSLNEGTPLTLIEALAAGVPVISTAVGGVVDVLGPVEEHVGQGSYDIRARGISVPSNDDQAFAAGLRRLIDDIPLRQRLAESGRNFARTAYSRDRLVTDIIALYRDLREQTRRG